MFFLTRVCVIFLIALRYESLGNPTPLLTRQITNFGIWSESEYCPWGTYVVGMSLKQDKPSSASAFTDHLGLTGIKFYCSPEPWNIVASRTQTVANAIKRNQVAEITSGHYPVGAFGKDFMCNGIALGVQFRVESYQGPFGDDTGINNVRLECFDVNEEKKYMLAGDGTSFGNWRAKYSCPVGKALCGLETQVDMDPSSDGVGLNNANVFCCTPAIIDDEGESNDTLIMKESIVAQNLWHKSHEYSNGVVLKNLPIQNSAKPKFWNDWEYCPTNYAITSMGMLKYEITENDEAIGFVGFKCQNKLENIWIRSNNGDLSTNEIEPSGGALLSCPEKHVAVGIVPFLNPGTFNYDKFNLICRSSSQRIEVENVTWPEAHYTYLELEKLECPSGHYICGLRGQFLDGENGEFHPEIQSIEIKCCAITRPTSTAVRNSRFYNYRSQKKQYSENDRDVYVLTTPGNGASGNFTPWQRCGRDSRITGKLSILYGFNGTGFDGIRLPCVDSSTLEIATGRYTDQQYKNFDESCPGNEVIGIQVKLRPSYEMNNTANMEIMDMRLYCNEHHYIGTLPAELEHEDVEGAGAHGGLFSLLGGMIFSQDESSETEEPLDDLVSNPLIQEGTWGPIQYCRKDEVVCGARAVQKGVRHYISNLQFECCEIAVGLNRSETSYGSMLSNKNSPQVPLMAFDFNGSQEWSSIDYCSDHHFASGFQIKIHDSKLTGLQLLCINPTNEDIQRPSNVAETIGTLELSIGNYSKSIFCPQGGVAIGYEVQAENGAITNFKLYCSWSEGNVRNFVYDTTRPLSNSNNQISIQKHCPLTHALCGIQTSFPSSSSSNFLSGISATCCKVNHPASSCTPISTWEIIGGLDNRKATTLSLYNYNRRTGITQTHTRNQNLLREKSFAENIGYNTDVSSTRENSTQKGQTLEDGKTGSTSSQSSSDISISQALADSMTHSASSEHGSSSTVGQEFRLSRSSQTSNSRSVENSKSHSSGHSAGGSVSLGLFGIGGSANYNYDTRSESRNSETTNIGQTSGKEVSSGQSSSNSQTNSNSISKQAALSTTKNWGNTQTQGQTELAGISSSHSENTVAGIIDRISKSNSQSLSNNLGENERIEWSTSDTRVWTKEVSETIDISIPPGVKVDIYQAKGICSFYEVRSPLVKRVDTLAQDFEKIYAQT